MSQTKYSKNTTHRRGGVDSMTQWLRDADPDLPSNTGNITRLTNPINDTTQKASVAVAGIHAAKKVGNTTGIITSAWNKLFGGGSGASGGGISGFFGNLFSSGNKMLGASALLNTLGAFISGFDKTQEKLDTRRLDIMDRELDIREELGKDELEIQRMKAENAIVMPGLGSTFMGWSPEQANRPGVFEGTPGLKVAQPTSGGMISPPKQGLITQADQAVV